MIQLKLSELMGKHRIKSFVQLERETGITRKTLAKLYNGEGGGIDYDTLNRLCAFFNCGVGDLIEYVAEKG